MNDCDKSKIRGIVKSYLLIHDRRCSSKELLEFINGHNFGLWQGINMRQLSSVMDGVNKRGIGKDVYRFYDKREKQRYYEVK